MMRGPSWTSSVGGMTSFVSSSTATPDSSPTFFFFFFFLGGGGASSPSPPSAAAVSPFDFDFDFDSGGGASPSPPASGVFSSSSGASATTFCGFFEPDGVLPCSMSPPSFDQKERPTSAMMCRGFAPAKFASPSSDPSL